MKLVVFGACGQLGQSFQSRIKEFKDSNIELKCLSREELDLANFSELKNYLEKEKPDYVLNASAYTAVDKAEEEKDKAFFINSEIVENLAKETSLISSRLIHISTDYVFSGDSSEPYLEDSKTNPLSIYGESKLAGEKFVLGNAKDNFVIRVSWLYSEFGNNFVKTIQRLSQSREEVGIVYDQISAPTYAGDLVNLVKKLILENKDGGLYHYSNEGVASWFDFACAIVEILDLKLKVKAIRSSDYPTPAKRPAFSLMAKEKIKKDLDLEIRHWRDALEFCIKNA